MKQKVFYLFALLLMAATSAWAQGSAVTLAGGTDDAANWTITPNADVAAGSQVAVSYGGSLTVNSLTATETHIDNMLSNGSFDANTDVWYGWGSTQSWDATGGTDGSGAVKIVVVNNGNIWDAAFAQSLSALTAGKTCMLRFKIRASGTGHVQYFVQAPSDTNPNAFIEMKEVGTSWTTIEKEFTVPSDGNSYTTLQLQVGQDANTYWIDDVELGEVKQRAVAVTEVEAGRQWTLTMPKNNVTLQVAYAPAYRVSFAAGTNFDANKWSLTVDNGNPASVGGLVNPGSQVAIAYNGDLKVNGISAIETHIDNMLSNGSFDANTNEWYGWGSTQSWDATGGTGGSGAVKIEVTNAGNIWDAAFAQSLSALTAGKTCMLRFKIRASGTGHVQYFVQASSDTNPNAFIEMKEVGTSWTTIEKEFTVPSDGNSYITLQLQVGQDANTYWIDDVELGEVKQRAVTVTETETGRQWTMTMPKNNVSLQVDYKPSYKVSFIAGTNFKANEWTLADANGKALPNGGLASPGDLVTIVNNCHRTVNSITAVEKYIDNVLSNGSFDSGTDGWFGWGNGSQRGWDATGGTNGSGAMKITVNTQSAYIYEITDATDIAALEAGKTYVLRFKVRSSGTGHVQSCVQQTTDPYPAVGYKTTTTGTGWTTVETQFTVTADGNSYTRLCLQTGLDANTTYWIDDVELGELKERAVTLTEVEAGRRWTFTMPANAVELQANCERYYVDAMNGTEDADNWTIGTTRVGQPVTVTYNGTRKVKSVKAKMNLLAIPLTVEALTAGTIVLRTGSYLGLPIGIKYAVNGGNKKLVTDGTTISGLQQGDKVAFYANGVCTQSYYDYDFSIDDGTAEVKVYGNIMSLLDEENYATTNNTKLINAFRGLFRNNTMLKDASGLLLPAQTLTENCYAYMFQDCTSLVAGPVLPAPTLTEMCYMAMFSNCSSLTSLTCLATNISASYCTNHWTSSVPATGTFTKAAGMTGWETGDRGIPSGWTVKEAEPGSLPVTAIDVAITPVVGTANQWTLTMPENNVELEVEYYTESKAAVKLAASDDGGTATLTDATFKPLTQEDKVTSGDRFVLNVNREDGYDFNVSLSTGNLNISEFSEEEYQSYLDYAKANNIAVPLNTVLAWVTMPYVASGDLTVTVDFQKLKNSTVLYKPTTAAEEVWCRFGLSNGTREAVKMKCDAEVGSEKVWSVKMSAASTPTQVAFFTTEEAAKSNSAVMNNAVVSQSATSWQTVPSGQYILIGGNAKTVVAAFVGNAGTMAVYNSETGAFDATDATEDVKYQLAVCPTDANGNVTEPATITAAPAPATAPEGKTFALWSVLEGTAPNKVEKLYNAGQTGISISENTIFTAVWMPQTLTATLNLNGGTGAATSSNVAYGQPLAIAADPSREGFVFDGWTVSQSVTESGQLFGKDSPFDLSTPITADLGLTAQWKHEHDYTCFQISDLGEAMTRYQNYNHAVHIAACACNHLELQAHTFDASGRCDCGYEMPKPSKVTLNVSYGQWSGGTYTEKMQGLPEEVWQNQEVSISAPANWGSLQFQKWQFQDYDGLWLDLTADAYASFLIPATMYVRALYVNPVTEPQVELSARQHDDQAEVDGKTYTMDNVLFQMNYRLPDGYSMVDAGIRMGDNGGISYYELKERTYTMDAECKAIGVGICTVTSILSGSINTFDASASEKYYAERENSVLDEMSATTLAEYMMQSKPVNVEKYPPIYWEANAPTKAMSGSICTTPPLRFIQKNNGQHWIYGIGYLKYKDPQGNVKTICTDALPTTRDNIPDYTVTKTGTATAGARQAAAARRAATRPLMRAPQNNSDDFDMSLVFASETRLTVYVDGKWSAALSDSYGFGDKAVVTAPAVDDKTFAYWEAEGQPISTAATLTLTMNANTTLRAVYDGSTPQNVGVGVTSITRTSDGSRISLQAMAAAQATAAGIVYSTTATGDALTIGGDDVTQVAAETITDATTQMPASVLDENHCWMLQITPQDAAAVYHVRAYATIGGNTVYSNVHDVTLADLQGGIQRICNLEGFKPGITDAMAEVQSSILTLNETTDNAATLAEWNGREANVTLTRTLQTGGYNTFAVPFSMDIPSGWTVKELSSASFSEGVLTLNFGNAASIVAGKPYLVKVSATTNLSAAAFTGVTVSKDAVPFTSTDVDFIPTLGATTVTGDAKSILFLGAENKLYHPNAENSSMKGFRAYFQLKGEAAQARAFNIDLGDGEATGIISVSGSESMVNDSDGCYDLQGRRIKGKPTRKGIYVSNGKKTVIK